MKCGVCPLIRPQRASPSLIWHAQLTWTWAVQEPILALRRQLAVLAGEEAEAGMCWLQHAQLCRVSGHNEAAGTASLEALARSVPGAALERARLLWDRDQQHDAILKLKEVRYPYSASALGI